MINKNIKKVKNKELEDYIKTIIQDIMNTSKEYQKFKIDIDEEI